MGRSNFVIRFWRGEIDLSRAFWTYALFYGTLLHVICTAAALLLFSTDAPDLLAAAVFLAPLPYTIWSVVGVWRSAARCPRNAFWPDLARGAVLIWGIAATFL
jgi:hypothetical protein